MIVRFRPGAIEHRTEQAPSATAHSAPAVTSVTVSRRFGRVAKQRDEQRADERRQYGQEDETFGRQGPRHRSPPSRLLAALPATPAVHSVSMPK